MQVNDCRDGRRPAPIPRFALAVAAHFGGMAAPRELFMVASRAGASAFSTTEASIFLVVFGPGPRHTVG